MITGPEIEKRTEEAINSLDGIQRATPAPYFFTRLQAKLSQEQKNIWEKISLFINRPAVAFATISFVLVLNAFAFLRQQSQQAPVPSITVDMSEQDMNNAYDFASKTNNTLLKIWNEDAQPIKK